MLPVELLTMNIYEFCRPQEKVILNLIFKLKYKYFNPMKKTLKFIKPTIEMIGWIETWDSNTESYDISHCDFICNYYINDKYTIKKQVKYYEEIIEYNKVESCV